MVCHAYDKIYEGMTLDTIQTVPLKQWRDGSIRIRNSRLLIDMVIGLHRQGAYPEEIFEAFPSVSYTVADIYAVIAYYLAHKSELDKYLATRKQESEKIWKEIEADPDQRAGREDLRDRINVLRAKREAENS